MTVLTFPTNPTLGQLYNAPNQIRYVYDGVKWIVETVASTSLAVTNSVQDRVAPMFVAGPHQGINFAYNAGTNVISATVTAGGNSLINGAQLVKLESNGNITAPAFTIPNAVGTSGQVLKWPSSGSTLVWATDSSTTNKLVNGVNELVLGSTGVLSLPNSGTINDYVGSAGVLGILIDRTFQTPDNTNSANFGTDTVKLLLSDVEAAEIVSYLTASIGVRVWFNQGDSYPITSCVQVSTGIWTVTATGMGNTFATFAASNTLIFIYTGATPNTYTNFPQYVPVGDGAGITISKGGNSWTFGTDGSLTLPNGEPILFGNGNSRIQAGMGFHINSEEGISLEAVDATDPLNPITHYWQFNINDTLAYPNSAVQRDTATVTCAGNASTVVYTASGQYQHTIRLLIQVEGNVGAAANWDTQACEMIIAKSWRANDVAATVYGIVHTSVAPLATFTAEWNAVTSRVEVLCATPSANSVHVRTFATEIYTAD